MSNLSIYHSFYKPMSSYQPYVQTTKPSVVQPKKKDDKLPIAKLAIGLGLTALAAGGIYIACRGKGAKEALKQVKKVIEDGKFTIEETGRSTY